MFPENNITYIKTSSKILREKSPSSRPRIKHDKKRHMIPIDLLLHEFSVDVDPDIIYKRLENMVKDCNIDEITISGVTALTQSALDGRLESVKFLIELGADVNKKDRLGWTPLHYAVSEGYEDICTYLIQNGADCNMRTKDGECTFELAEDENIVNLLINAALSQGKISL